MCAVLVILGCSGENVDELPLFSELEDFGKSSGWQGGGASSSSVRSSSSFVNNVTCSVNFRTVTIGTQIWMAENLNCNVGGSKCYDNSESNCNEYGRLYDWTTAMNLPSSCNSSYCSSQIQSPHRGICPSGWHIPNNADWDKLYRYADGTSGTSSPYDSPTAGKYLKATSGWYNNGNGTDQYGFSALPGGNGYSGDGGFGYENVGLYGGWWSASEGSSYGAYYRYMYYSSDGAYLSGYDKSDLRSVRCVQD